MGGGCKVFTVLCSLGIRKVGRQHIICLQCVHVLKVMMKRGVVFHSDHLENSLITSQNVMELVYWNSILPGKPWNSTSTLLHV